MDIVCRSPWLSCRTAEVAPSPLTERWRLYLSPHDAVFLTVWHTCIYSTHLQVLTEKLAKSCINKNVHRKVHTWMPDFRFMCLHLQMHNRHWSMQKHNQEHVHVLTQIPHTFFLHLCLPSDTFITPSGFLYNQHQSLLSQVLNVRTHTHRLKHTQVIWVMLECVFLFCLC